MGNGKGAMETKKKEEQLAMPAETDQKPSEEVQDHIPPGFVEWEAVSEIIVSLGWYLNRSFHRFVSLYTNGSMWPISSKRRHTTWRRPCTKFFLKI